MTSCVPENAVKMAFAPGLFRSGEVPATALEGKQTGMVHIHRVQRPVGRRTVEGRCRVSCTEEKFSPRVSTASSVRVVGSESHCGAIFGDTRRNRRRMSAQRSCGWSRCICRVASDARSLAPLAWRTHL